VKIPIIITSNWWCNLELLSRRRVCAESFH